MNRDTIDDLYKEFSLYLQSEDDLLYELCKIISKKIPKSMVRRLVNKLYRLRNLWLKKSRYFGEQIIAEWVDEDSDDNCIIAESKYEIQELIDLAGIGEIKVVSYVNKSKIYENTMFLTQKDAEDHLKANYYHYSEDAHTYAMTAWRSNRVEKLINILQSVDFGKE